MESRSDAAGELGDDAADDPLTSVEHVPEVADVAAEAVLALLVVAVLMPEVAPFDDDDDSRAAAAAEDDAEFDADDDIAETLVIDGDDASVVK